MPNDNLDFLAIAAEGIYASGSVPEAAERIAEFYRNLFNSTGNIHALEHALKLEEYVQQYVVDRTYSDFLKKEIFYPAYDMLDREEPELLFFMEGRTKSLVKLLLKMDALDRENRSLDLLRDQKGFRIILFPKNRNYVTEDFVQTLYRVTERCVALFLSYGFVPCDIDNPNLCYGGENESLRFKVKDYYLHPKSNGYRSLHLVFRCTNTDQTYYGRYFELQILDLNSFIINELDEDSPCSHRHHDEERHNHEEDNPFFDPMKVQMSTFVVDKDGNILLDIGGLYLSSKFMHRKRSF
jgi:hypothetical protein